MSLFREGFFHEMLFGRPEDQLWDEEYVWVEVDELAELSKEDLEDAVVVSQEAKNIAAAGLVEVVEVSPEEVETEIEVSETTAAQLAESAETELEENLENDQEPVPQEADITLTETPETKFQPKISGLADIPEGPAILALYSELGTAARWMQRGMERPVWLVRDELADKKLLKLGRTTTLVQSVQLLKQGNLVLIPTGSQEFGHGAKASTSLAWLTVTAKVPVVPVVVTAKETNRNLPKSFQAFTSPDAYFGAPIDFSRHWQTESFSDELDGVILGCITDQVTYEIAQLCQENGIESKFGPQQREEIGLVNRLGLMLEDGRATKAALRAEEGAAVAADFALAEVQARRQALLAAQEESAANTGDSKLS